MPVKDGCSAVEILSMVQVFDTLQDAIDYSIAVMADHFDRGLGLSDARIECFKEMAG